MLINPASHIIRTMKAILFDPFSGASGDMIIAALIDLGANESKVKEAMELAANVEVEVFKTNTNGVAATLINVTTKKEGSSTLEEIIKRIESLNLPSIVSEDAISVFKILGEAEAKVHDVAIEKFHFHELGQEDAIADIVGACAAFHDLKLKNHRVYCTPISAGEGFVEFSHGKFPIPAPATLEILKEYSLSWQFGPCEGELLTPTGAALLAHFVNEKGDCSPLKTLRTGYGAGGKELSIPNVLRIIEGEINEALISEKIEILETNVDDVTGVVLGNLIDELMKAGALDVAIIPATMKKNRSGHVVQVIAKPSDSQKLARKIIEETGSLGVRMLPVKHRLIAQREISEVEILVNGNTFSIPVKIARDLRGTLLNISAEFEGCKNASHESRIPVREIIRKAEEKARQIFS